MNRTEIEQKVKALIVEKLNVDEKEVTPEAGLTNDLGADSLDTVELVQEIEKEFNIEILDTDAYGFETFGNVIDYLEKHVK